MRSAPSQDYKLAKLTSDHQELLRQYNMLYNIAAEMRRQLTSAPTAATEPPAKATTAPESDSSDEEGAAKAKTKDEDKSKRRKPNEEPDQPKHQCFMAIANDRDQAYLSSGSAQQPQMSKISALPITMIPAVVDHWIELCSGGLLAGLSAALSNGIVVRSVTLVEKSNMVRYTASARLRALHHEHPHLLDKDVVDHPFSVNQDVTKVTAAKFGTTRASTVIFATPPCQPFSKVGHTPGWSSEESVPFISCVNLINDISIMRGRKVTYFIENVPNSSHFIEILDALGPAIVVEAHKLGSSALRKTALWTNVATRSHLEQHYAGSYNPGDTVTCSNILSQTGTLRHTPDAISQSSWHEQEAGCIALQQTAS